MDSRFRHLSYVVSPINTHPTPTTIDFSYYVHGMEIIHDSDVFDDDGNVMGLTELVVDEKYFKNLYMNFVHRYGTALFQKFNGIKILHKIDGGAFGEIYTVKYNENEYILKMEKKRRFQTHVQFKNKILNEVEIQDRLSRALYSIPIIDYDIYEYDKYMFSYILMEKMTEYQYTLETILKIKNISSHFFKILYQKLKNLIKKLCEMDIVHGDLHWGNIYITVIPNEDTSLNISEWKSSEISVGVIDFGFSLVSRCNIEIELLALLKGIHHKKYSHRNFRKIKQVIYDLFSYFNLEDKYLDDMRDVHSRYNHLLRKYIM